MEPEDREGKTGSGGSEGSPQREAGYIPDPSVSLDAPLSFEFPEQSPLFHAENAARYDRQGLITQYEDAFNCRLIVVIDNIFNYGITLLEELIYEASPSEDLHLLLWTPGGDGETAVRMVRSLQARCNELTIIVPDQAKSAGTLLCMGAHHIMMGPTSDLGPIDPQFFVGNTLVSAKDIITAVEDATAKVQEAPDTFPIHAALLSDVTALMVQQAKSAMSRTDELAREALRSLAGRSDDDVNQLLEAVLRALVDDPSQHSALVGAGAAAQIGLPVIQADPAGPQWRLLWRLWAKYFALQQRAYEGRRSSKIMSWPLPYET